MKKGWKSKALGDVVSFQRGLTYSKKDEVDFSSNIVLRANNINLKTNRLDFSELKYINDDIAIPKERKVSKGSLIICTASGSKSHLGKVALIDDSYNYAFGGFMGQLNPSKEIDSKYLFYLLTSDDYKTFINRLSDGVNINNLRFDNLSKFPISLPPLPEQERVAKILNGVFGKITKAKENAEKNLQNARELFKAYLQNIFANSGEKWEVKRLGEVYDVRDGTHDSPKYQNIGFALITSKNLKKDKINYDKIRYISENDYKKINQRSKVHKGDVLFAMIGTIGNPVVVEIDPDFAIKNVALFKVPNKQSNYFLKYYLDSKAVIDRMMSEAKGTTQKFVGLGYLRAFKIKIPSFSKQQAIVVKLGILSAETKKLEGIYQQKLADLEELKKSILQKAFNGELVGVYS